MRPPGGRVGATLRRLADHEGEAGAVVAGRAPGSSPLAALRRHFRAGPDHRDPVTGLNDDPGVLARPGGTQGRVTVLPASATKGLEYDHVIAVEPAEIVRAEPRGLHRLYVVLTRAVSRLHVLHAEPLPEALARAAPAEG